MAANERIWVDRPGNQGAQDAREIEGVSQDLLMGCRWDILPARILSVYAWRNGEETLVAQYLPGSWLAVQFARCHK